MFWKDHQYILGGIFIVLLGGLVFNLDNITGNAVRNEASLQLSPSVIQQGDEMHLAIRPTSEGVGKTYAIYRNERQIVSKSENLCENDLYRCYDDMNFDLPIYLEKGMYTVKIYDYKASKYLERDFRVTEQ